MSEKRCIKCGLGPLEIPPTGRRPIYCGESCRAAAAHEVKRLDRRMAQLEDQDFRVRMDLETDNWFSSEDRADLRKRQKFLRKEMSAVEARLRALLAAGGTSPGLKGAGK